MGRSPWIDIERRNNWMLQACSIKPDRIFQKRQRAGRKALDAMVDTKLRRVHRLTGKIRYDVHYHVHITKGQEEKNKEAKCPEVTAAFFGGDVFRW